jgi:hypothetical protein
LLAEQVAHGSPSLPTHAFGLEHAWADH